MLKGFVHHRILKIHQALSTSDTQPPSTGFIFKMCFTQWTANLNLKHVTRGKIVLNFKFSVFTINIFEDSLSPV